MHARVPDEEKASLSAAPLRMITHRIPRSQFEASIKKRAPKISARPLVVVCYKRVNYSLIIWRVNLSLPERTSII